MSALRSLKREMVKTQCYKRNGNKKSFKDEWDKIHYHVANEKDDDKIKKEKIKKKKQKHFDDGKSYMKYLKAWKSMVDNMKTNKSNAREKVC